MNHQSPIFVVSLTRSKERRQEISAFLDNLDLEFEFFDAIDGENIPSEYMARVDQEFSLARKILGRGLSKGEVGCALSHALLYEKMVMEGIDFAYILEDDAIPGESFANLVKKATLAKDSRIELATFRYQPLLAWRRGEIQLASGLCACRPMQHPFSTVAYYITRAAASRLREAAFPISVTADWPTAIHKWPTTYCVWPRLVDTWSEDENSILHPERAALEAERCRITESMEMLLWPAPYRILGRLFSLSLIPCLLWPDVFGTVEDSINFAKRARRQLLNSVNRTLQNLLGRLWGRQL